MLTRILVALFLISTSLYAAETPPSDASLKQLLEITQVHNLLDNTLGQMDAMMTQMFQQAISGEKPSPEMQKLFDKSRADVVAMCKETLTWERMEPIYLRIYRKSLSQSDVDGMIAFYKTPAGQAVIVKLPAIMQNTMAEVGNMMGPMMERAKQMQQELMAEAQKEKAKSGG